MLFHPSSIFNFDFFNREPFLALQSQYSMRKLTNTRQKLIINRKRKNQTPPKLQIEVRNGSTAIAWAPRLKSKDTNITKLNNSSNLRKQNFAQPEKKQKNHRELLRCRSISVMEQRQRSKSKLNPLLPAVIPNLEEKSSLPSNRDESVLEASRIYLAKMKEKGAVSIKNNYYTIHHEDFLDLIAESFEKANRQPHKNHKNNLNEISQITESQPQGKPYETFNVFNQYSIKQTYQKVRNLSQHSRIVDQHHAFEEDTINRQTFWRIVNTEHLQKPTQQNLIFLLSKFNYLKQEVSRQQVSVRELKQKIQELNCDISSKQKSIEDIQQKRQECFKYLQEIEETAKQMVNFIDKQPNRILQQQAKEYKQREQELFDLAFQYQQQTPSSILSHIEESIMIPFESFKLTIQSFPHDYVDAEDDYTISKKSMDDFKASLRSAYDSTIAKLSAIIEKKVDKIKNFVGIMRRLASYTIGKREYLGEINKKMAVVSIQIDKSFKSLEGQVIAHSLADNVLKKLGELKQLFHNIKTIYCEAQVFY